MSDYTFQAGDTKIVLNNVYGVCTKCRAVLPINKLGLRNTSKGRVNNQPQCIKCRGAGDE